MTRFVNNFKTVLLLGLLFGIILLVGSRFGVRGLTIAFLLGGLMNLVAYFFSDRIALMTMQAKEVDDKSAPDLVPMVRRLADNAGLPMPRVYICPQDAPNAFATGRSPRHAAVAVTNGAIRLLNYEELEGVLAHELAHVKNRDTLISCIAATIAGAISYLAHLMFFFGGRSDDDEGGGLGLLGGLLMVILAPIAAMLIQMAISRSREYVADADGARIAGSPRGLADALRKLEMASKRIPMMGGMPATNHLFIVKPFSGESLANLFSTHPPTAERIKRLQELA